MKKKDFETSSELKRLFNEHFDRWSQKTRYTVDDLAERCGVSTSYMSHVRRYGRIPGKPILYLIALNLGVENPKSFLSAANITNPWPYEPFTSLQVSESSNAGFVSVKIDMNGLTAAIGNIIRSELKPKTLREITKGKPIRIGYNTKQIWLFDPREEQSTELPTGIFVELFKIIGDALGEKIEFSVVDFRAAKQLLNEDKLDIYGPLFKTQNRLVDNICTEPFCRVQVTALWRKNPNKYLENMPAPVDWENLKNPKYKIALLRNSVGHEYAVTRLKRSDENLILCDSIEEIVERLTLGTTIKPAHLTISDAGGILAKFNEAEPLYEILFAESEDPQAEFGDCLAVRPDWPELASNLNQLFRDVNVRQSIKELFEAKLDLRLRKMVRFSGLSLNNR